jgi:malonyl CoA-acyl carrier protein transacylase
VLAGEIPALDHAVALLRAEGVEAQRLDVPRAFHSSLMASAKSSLAADLRTVPLYAPRRRYLSSITRKEEQDVGSIRRALVEQLTEPVDFVTQICTVNMTGVDVFIECGPRGVLASLVRRILDPNTVSVITVDDRDRPGRFALAKVSAMLDALESVPMSQPSSTEKIETYAENVLLSLFEGDAGAELLREDGFHDFWERTRPAIIALIESLWASEQKKSVPVVTAVPTPISDEDAAPRAPAVSAAEIQSYLVEAFAKETGYPPDLIDAKADLEADLGIDTVKQAQVLGRARDHFDVRTDEKLSLRDFPTVSHIVSYIEKVLAKAPKVEERRSRVPMVDITEKRSKPPK